MTLIRTHSGKLVDLTQILPSDILIGDIAHALANICRYGGHPEKFYSVAQHSLRVARKCPDEFALEGLLHDAAEAYIGDLVKPLKILLGEPVAKLEREIEQAIAIEFNLTFPWPACVKVADDELLRIEQINFWPGTVDSHTGQLRKLESLHSTEVITPYPPGEAKRMFVNAFEELTGRRRRKAAEARRAASLR